MTKEEILAKSRAENQNKDMVELEIVGKAQRVGGIISIILAFVLMLTERLLGSGMNYGYFLIALSACSALWIYKAICLRRKHEKLFAGIFSALTLNALIMYIISLGGITK